ncbi:MAG: Na/Pi cotransporter family protein [Clostridiales bacterium]|nr:Na/Pi cotransporter family protein [Clostridiales bacterium]
MIWNIFFMFGGVAVMMFGMKIMGSALEQVAGGGMKKMLGKITTNRFAGVGVGIAVTSIIQSSTATTVMLVGFVNVGILTLSQALNVIMGANIGTTVTAHIVSLSGVGSIDIGAIAAMLGCIGVLMSMLVKNEKVANIGSILGGLGLIFVGLEFISSYAKEIMFVSKDVPYDWVKTIFQGDHNPLLLILIGIVLTALVHSSSTITSLMVVLATIKVLTFDNALFLALGSNIGTCITAILSSAGTCTNAKRTAVLHLLFNTIGCLIFLAPIWIWKTEVTNLFASMSPVIGTQVAIFHTLFNIVVTAFLMPFTKYLVRLVCLIVPESQNSEERFGFMYIDDRLMSTPAVAVGNIRKEIVRMGEFAKQNVNESIEMLLDSSVDNTESISDREIKINALNKNLTAYLTKLMGKELTDEDDRKVGSYYHVVSDIERVGDYAENVMEYANRLREEDLELSSDAVSELNEFKQKVLNLYDLAFKAFDTRDISILPDVEAVEEDIDTYCQTLEKRHINRVKKGGCSAQAGSVFLQTISNLERVADHINNVAKSIKVYKEKAQKQEIAL